MTDARPDITSITDSAELRRWYWLKTELVAEAKRRGLRTTGAKFAVLDRLAHLLDTGETVLPGDAKPGVRSKFDWHSAELSPQTVITNSYRNSQNVRRFFKSQVGPAFKFNIAFMAWMRANVGKTLAHAVAEYRRQDARTTRRGHKTQIAEHNQFNQYTRDFLADNPDLGLSDVRHFWALKRQQPSDDGRHRYAPSDLLLEPAAHPK
jgi:hypothetical protein